MDFNKWLYEVAYGRIVNRRIEQFRKGYVKIQKNRIKKMRHKVQFKDGKVTFYNPKRFHEEVASREGKDGFLDLSDYDPAASRDQFGFYFATLNWYIDNSEFYAGNEVADLDHYFCKKYLTTQRVVYFNGDPKETPYVQSKTSIGKKKMAEFITKVLAELAENTGLTSPTSEEAITGKYRSVNKEAKTL